MGTSRLVNCVCFGQFSSSVLEMHWANLTNELLERNITVLISLIFHENLHIRVKIQTV